MTRENIKGTNEKETNLRTDRSDNRTDKLEVILPDGTKLIRRPTEQLGKKEGKLAIPHKEGFERRWVKNETEANLQYYIDLGYVPATDKNGKPYEAIRGGLRKNNTEYKLYPLEIPTNELEKLRRKHEELDASAIALANQKKWLEGQHVDGLTYNPDGTINRVEIRDVKSPLKK